MDPEANLQEQWRLATAIHRSWREEQPLDENKLDRLCELVVSLDDWIKRGGFKPKRWVPRFTTANLPNKARALMRQIDAGTAIHPGTADLFALSVLDTIAEENPLMSDEAGSYLLFGVLGVAAIAGGYALYKSFATPAASPTSTSSSPTTMPAVLHDVWPTTGWVLMDPSESIAGGQLYLASVPPTPGATFGEYRTSIADILKGAWDVGAIPASWPADDRDPNRWRAEIGAEAGAAGGTVASLATTMPGLRMYRQSAPSA